MPRTNLIFCLFSAREDVRPAPHPDHDYVQLPLSLEEQLEAARQEIARLTQENTSLRVERFGIQRYQNDPKLLRFYTGFQVGPRNKMFEFTPHPRYFPPKDLVLEPQRSKQYVQGALLATH